MKLSVFTVVTPDMTPEQFAAAASKAGIQGVEWRFKEVPEEAKNEAPSFWRNNLCSIDPGATDEELNVSDQAAKTNGLSVVSVTPYLKCGDLEATEHVMRVAKKLGASTIRVGVPGYNGQTNYNELFDQAVQYLHGVEELSKSYGVKGLVETHHGTITASASLAHRLVSKFNPDQIGVLFDPGNMVHEGYENFRMGMELLGPYLAHVHVKNAGWIQTGERKSRAQVWKSVWFPIMEGQVQWKQVLKDLKAVGYDGWFGVEDFSGALSTEDVLKSYAAQMRSMLEE